VPSRFDRDDRVAPPERPRHQECGFRDPDHRDVDELARRREAGITEGGDDRRVGARAMLGEHVEDGVRRDRRLDAVLDVQRAEPCRGGRDLGARRRGAPRLGGHDRRDVFRDVRVDEQQLHAQ
jgi:hypothetical protein